MSVYSLTRSRTRFFTAVALLVVAGSIAGFFGVRGLVAEADDSPDGLAVATPPPVSTPVPGAAVETPTGVISDEEHEAAIAAYLACIEDKGLGVLDVYPGEGRRPTRFTIRTNDSDGTPDAATVRNAQAALMSCQKDFAGIDAAWSLGRPRPTSVEIDAMLERVVACVADGGVPELGDVPSSAVPARSYGPDVRPTFPWTDLGPDAAPAARQCFAAEEAVSGLQVPLATWDCYAPPEGIEMSAKWMTLCVVNGPERAAELMDE